MAGYHKNLTILKHKATLDAFLGETFQAKKSDGSHIYVEQTSSDPPKSSYLLVGPENIYKLYGTGEVFQFLCKIKKIRYSLKKNFERLLLI